MYSLILLLTLFSSCEQKAESTSYFFPSGFQGQFVIVYSKEEGCPRSFEQERRILKIPKSGILYTQFAFSDGVRDDVFYIRNAEGRYHQLKEFVNVPPELGSTKIDTSRYTQKTGNLFIRRGERIAEYVNDKEYIVETGYVENGNLKIQDESNSILGIVERQIKENKPTIECK